MNYRISVFVITLLMVAIPPVLAGKYPFPELADQLAKEADKILVKNRVCADMADCQKTGRTFRAGTPDHAIVLVYRSKDIDQKTMMEIINLCVNAYHTHDKRITVELRFYIETTEEKVALFSGVKPFVHLTLKGADR